MIKFWTSYNFISIIFLSLAVYFGWIFLSNNYEDFDISRALIPTLNSAHFYLLIFINCGTFICWELGTTTFFQQFYVSYDVLINYMDKYGYLKTITLERLKYQFSKRKAILNQVTQK